MIYDEIKRDFPSLDADATVLTALIHAYVEGRIESLELFATEELYQKLKSEKRDIKKYKSIAVQKQVVSDYNKTSENATV